MKCGKCKNSHDTVEEVRKCYNVQNNLPGKDYASKPPASKVNSRVNWDLLPKGHYATPSLTGNNDYDFWIVDKPEEGKWAGWTFISRVIGGRDDQQIPRQSKKHVKGGRVERSTQVAAMKAILEFGIEHSAEVFGKELKYCRVCGVHLTDETSRALGIGPICRAAL